MPTARVEGALKRLFHGVELDEARRVLPDRQPQALEPAYEQALVDVIKLSEGQLARLHYFAARADTHPEDVHGLAMMGELSGRLANAEIVRLRKTLRLNGGKSHDSICPAQSVGG